ncbi:hypothetical protein [Algoriphagus sp. Y33]|uniref:hypothetical protein n=1 Tax=Algoriphagus sp. Y33 TaxID=2772483 RepID=UPI00177BFF30|nr:hypothetical protein [Algoriphagus sp. Y33]
MNSEHFHYAWYKLNWIWVLSFMTSIGGILIISINSENPEFFSYGYELGVFFMPVFSSLIVSIPIIFFTSHMNSAIREFQAFAKFEAYRLTVIDILKIFHEVFGDKEYVPNFNESDLSENYSVIISEEAIQKEIFSSTYSCNLKLYDLLTRDVETSMMIIKSKEFSDLNSTLYDCIIYYTRAKELLVSEKDYNAFLFNLKHILGLINIQISENDDYQFYFKIVFGKIWTGGKLLKRVVINA